MFRNAIELPFRVLGIPIKLDRSFLLILPLFAWIIGSQVPAFVEMLRGTGPAIDPTPLTEGLMPYVIGLIAAIGLFTSVLIHELGHAVAGRMYGAETKEITLWFLGGVAQFDDMPRQRGAEAVVAIAGPITSFLLAILCWAIWQIPPKSAALLFIFSYLATTNAALAIFNLLPALPLDGGRVLRSLLALRLEYVRATRIAANISRVLAILMGIFGVLSTQWLLVAVAFFIYNAVQAETRHAVISSSLEHLKVRDVMTTEVATVDPDMPLEQFAQLIYFKKHLGYPVVSAEGTLLGFAKLQDAQEHPQGQTVADIMRPARTIADSAEAIDALKHISEADLGRLVVLDSLGKMVGVVGKTDLIKAMQTAS